MTEPAREPVYLHATAVIVGETGLLLRGPSGVGKSGLALTLIHFSRARGDFAGLVGDDRVAISRRSDRLIARPHPAIAGMIESRGYGLLCVPFESACVLRAIIDVVPPGAALPRLPEPHEKYAELEGVRLPRLTALGSDPLAWSRIFVFIQNDMTF